MNLSDDQIRLFIGLRNDYSFYLSHMGFEDNPISLSVYEGYFNGSGGKTIIALEHKPVIFDEIRYQISKLADLFDDPVEHIENRKVCLYNGSYFRSVTYVDGLRGMGFSHLLVRDGMQHLDDFHEKVAPIVAACRVKMSIIP